MLYLINTRLIYERGRSTRFALLVAMAACVAFWGAVGWVVWGWM